MRKPSPGTKTFNVTNKTKRNTRTPRPQPAIRFSVSLGGDLLRELDGMVRQRRHVNRSRAIAEMIRDRLVEHRQEYGDQEMAGTITLIYDHHTPQVQARLTAAQHEHHHAVVSNLHVHLDRDNCLEVIVVRGRARQIKAIADRLMTTRGVKHGKLTLTDTGAPRLGEGTVFLPLA